MAAEAGSGMREREAAKREREAAKREREAAKREREKRTGPGQAANDRPRRDGVAHGAAGIQIAGIGSAP
ncbi:hypothetical protein DM40_970 [Burkholderia cenocepacia]|nr:hypothetical protein DM40_970 [Burkholderia cenocepacia]